jgi:hypothetical protein
MRHVGIEVVNAHFLRIYIFEQICNFNAAAPESGTLFCFVTHLSMHQSILISNTLDHMEELTKCCAKASTRVLVLR